jgi:hypothetical protein
MFEVWPAPGARESLQTCGPRGRPNLKNEHTKTRPDCLQVPNLFTCSTVEVGAWSLPFSAGLHVPRGPTFRFHMSFRRSRWTGQTLRGLKFIIYCFIFLRSVPKTQHTPEWDVELASGADLWRNLRYFSSRGRSVGSRGSPWAPRGRKSARKPGAGFIIIPSLRSAQWISRSGTSVKVKPFARGLQPMPPGRLSYTA